MLSAHMIRYFRVTRGDQRPAETGPKNIDIAMEAGLELATERRPG